MRLGSGLSAWPRRATHDMKNAAADTSTAGEPTADDNEDGGQDDHEDGGQDDNEDGDE